MRCQTCPPFSPPPRFPTRTPLRHTNDTIEAVPRPSRRRFAPARGRAPCTVPCPILRRIVFAFSSGRLSKISTSRNQSRQAVAATAPCLRSIPCDPAAGEQRQIRPRPAAKECSPSKLSSRTDTARRAFGTALRLTHRANCFRPFPAPVRFRPGTAAPAHGPDERRSHETNTKKSRPRSIRRRLFHKKLRRITVGRSGNICRNAPSHP